MMRAFLGAVITALIAAVIISTAAIISAQAAGVPLLNFWDPTNNLGTFNDWIIDSLDPFLTNSGLIQLGAPINIRNYGADPTGSLDSTSAINTAMAAAGTQCVYAPAGTYKVTNAVNLNKAGCLFGDGLTTSVLHADSASFNLAALGVLVIPTNAGGNGPTVHDIGINFTQPDTAVRANIVAFPPGIYAQAVSRQIYTNVQVGGGSYCLDARGNSTVQILTFNCGSLVKGLQMDGGLDGSHVTGWHEWDFGIAGHAGLTAVYEDLTNICMEIGRVDGIVIASTQCYFTQIHFTANAANSTDAHLVTDAMMDAGSVLVDNTPSTGLLLTGIQFTSSNSIASTYRSLVVSAGNTKVVNCRIGHSPPVPNAMVQVTGGNLSLQSCILTGGSTSVSFATVATGTLDVSNNQITGPAGVTVPLFEQLSGALIFKNNRFGNAPSGGTGIAVKFDADNIQNYLGPNVYTNWNYTIPASTTLGNYGQDFTVAPPIGQATMHVTSTDSPAHVDIRASDGTDPADTYYTAGGEQWVLGVNGGATFIISEPAVLGAFVISPGGDILLGEGPTNLVTARGLFNATAGYQDNGTAGVNCSGSPTVAFASRHGIVTHC